MIPLKINVLEQKEKKWQTIHQFVYKKFNSLFNAEPIVNESLPINNGCKVI